MPRKKYLYTLTAILVCASVLRIYGLSRGDTVSDEVFMAFRGLGMIDFAAAPTQTTPWEWWDPVTNPGQASAVPWWAKLSMHDHPWGVPFIQHVSMSLFGESRFGFRLPSALLGIASVWLLYAIGSALYSEGVGLIAAGILAITVNSVYISRIGLQEAYVIFFMLLATLVFLKSLRDPRFLFWTSVVIGIGAEMKYTTLIVVPIFLTYLALTKRSSFKQKYLWYGIGVFLVLISPSVIYNIGLYHAVGHFDLQFSYALHQNPTQWVSAPGKDIGSLGDRIKEFVPNLIKTNSWMLLLAYAASLLSFVWILFKKPLDTLQRHGFLITATVFLAILMLLVGPSYRFLTMLTPFIAITVALFIARTYAVFPNARILLWTVGAALIAFEMFYSFNSQIAYYPVGQFPWAWSAVRYENYNWGYNALDSYLQSELGDKMPGVTFNVKYQFLELMREQAIAQDQAQGLPAYPALIVYNGNFDGGAKLWVLDRYSFYDAWPIIDLATYQQYLRENGDTYVEQSGFKVLYFIQETNEVPEGDLSALTGGSLTQITDPRGDVVFNVYKTFLP
ncbi:glycosyltransferase family 39 protein [Patescibacteria group bacterium]|nr:glycosyltransferase family 39 protein [Patescibacteria group bacterium]